MNTGTSQPCARRRTGDRGRRSTAIATTLLIASIATATNVEPGDPAPQIVGETIDGRQIDTTAMKDRPLLLLFGATGQDGTLQACGQIAAVLGSPRLADAPAYWVLILSKTSDPQRIARDLAGTRPRPAIVHDRNREAFGAYGTVVVPTVVVVDRRGRVAYVTAGMTNRFADILGDAMLLAAGMMTAERFEATLHPAGDTPIDPQHVRASRLTHLADRLSQRHLDDLAEARYRDAMKADPGYVPARLGLGELLLRLRRLDDANTVFGDVLSGDPDSTAARLGQATVAALRGGDGLEQAEEMARSLLDTDPRLARAHYVMGLVHEGRGDAAQAVASFRRAAELLLSDQRRRAQ